MSGPVKLGVEVAGLKELARDIRAADPQLTRDLKKALKSGADLIADEYRDRIEAYSSRIPETIKTGSTPTSSYVKAGGPEAPHSAAVENMGKTGTFRHPVFGNTDVWVEQDAHPAALPALQSRGPDVVDLVNSALADWAEAAGFRQRT